MEQAEHPRSTARRLIEFSEPDTSTGRAIEQPGLQKETTGRDFPVHPVIVYPGWFIRSEGRPKRPIWVLNPKALPKYLANAEPKLTKEEIQLASYHLSRFVRVEEERRSATKAHA